MDLLKDLLATVPRSQLETEIEEHAGECPECRGYLEAYARGLDPNGKSDLSPIPSHLKMRLVQFLFHALV